MPGGLELAFDLIQHLGESSYCDLDMGGSGEGDRCGDEEMDELMCELIKRMKEKDENWNPAEVFESLKAQHENLDDYGIDSFFTRSVELLSTLVEGA